MLSWIFLGLILSLTSMLLLRDILANRHAIGKSYHDRLNNWYKYDLGFSVLLDKVASLPHMGSLRAYLLILLVVPYGFYFIVSAIEHTLILEGEAVGFLEDYSLHAASLLFPLTIYLFSRMMKSIASTFQSIENANDKTKTAKNATLDELSHATNFILQSDEGFNWKHRIPELVAFTTAVVFSISVTYWDLYVEPEPTFHSNEYLLGDFVNIVHWNIILSYICPLGFGYIARLIWQMRSLGLTLHGKGILLIEPLHPDNSGGLGKFGKLAWEIDFIWLPLSISLVLLYVFEGYTFQSQMLTVILLVQIPCFFFVPLLGFHKAMKDAKTQELRSLSDQFTRNSTIMHKWLVERPNGVSDEEGAAAQITLERVAILYERASKMPVWPFDLTTLGAVSIYLLIPIALMFFQQLFG